MAREVTAKQRAARLDPTGYKRPSALRARPVAAWIVCVIALAWVMISGRPGGAQSIYMPGPVASAHASFADNCTVCHDGGGRGDETDQAAGSGPHGLYWRNVSDAACLKCHEAPVHHPKQVELRRGLSSATCTTCHAEHRGLPGLSAGRDATCTSCHADLTGKTLSPQPPIATKVTAFGDGTHPSFGRLLRGADGAWSDPTRLRFNHKLHFAQDSQPQLKQCATCHATAADLSDPNKAPALGAPARSYMLPVSYDQHCKSCHAITLPGAPTVALAHDRLDVVRAQLDSLPALIDRVVNAPGAAAPPANNEEAVARVQQELDNVTEALKGIARDNKPSFDRITQHLRAAAAGDPAAVKATTTESVLRGARVTQPHAKRVEWATVFASEGRCTKCHDVRGEVVPGFAEPSRPPAGDPLTPAWETLAAPPGAPLETEITGVSSAPRRRWFANARFDHRSHRNVTCLDCHAGVQDSTRTSDLSLPDLASKPLGRPTAKSCVECHHAGSGGAASTCVTCHSYHNSRLEHAPDGQQGRWDRFSPPSLNVGAGTTSAEEPATPGPVTPATQGSPATNPTAPTQPAPTDLPPPPDATAPVPPPATDLPPPPDAVPSKAGDPASDLPPPPDTQRHSPSPDLPPPP